MINFIKNIFSDDNGVPSVKRILSFIGTVALIGYMFLFNSTNALDAVTMIVLGCLGVTGAISIFGNKTK